MALTKNDYFAMEQDARRMLADANIAGDKATAADLDAQIKHLQDCQRGAPCYPGPRVAEIVWAADTESA